MIFNEKCIRRAHPKRELDSSPGSNQMANDLDHRINFVSHSHTERERGCDR
jgi:hypothetical protein